MNDMTKFAAIELARLELQLEAERAEAEARAEKEARRQQRQRSAPGQARRDDGSRYGHGFYMPEEEDEPSRDFRRYQTREFLEAHDASGTLSEYESLCWNGLFDAGGDYLGADGWAADAMMGDVHDMSTEYQRAMGANGYGRQHELNFHHEDDERLFLDDCGTRFTRKGKWE